MTWLYDLKLLRLFDFYLAVAFVASTVLRVQQYRAVIGLVRTFPQRWPRLFVLVKQHWQIFVTWGTLLPLLVSFSLLLAQTLAGRLLWPEADLTLGDLLVSWIAPAIVFISGAAMISFDIWGIRDVGEVNRVELEKHFDQAEYWLKSWAAPVVRFFTLGRIHPRKMVAKEVQSALLSASAMLNENLWWVARQAGLRILFGLSLWVSWALLVA